MSAKFKRKATADRHSLSLFGFGGDSLAEVSAPIVRLPSGAANDDLPEFDFASLFGAVESESELPSLPEIPVALVQEIVSAATTRVSAIAFAPAAGGPRNSRNYLLSSVSIPEGPYARMEANIDALRLRQEILSQGREASEEEKGVLARYSGWGGLDTIFRSNHGLHSELKDLLSEAEFAAASAGMLTQHFTPDFVVDFIYRALVKLGVKPKRLLDPSMGFGLFPARIPADWKDEVVLYGSDVDPVVSSIGALLLPDAKVYPVAFEKLRLPDNAFDAVITNVPFAASKPFDEETPNVSLSLHNFFIAKALRKVRPGGVVAVVTSTYSLDAKEEAVRAMFADQADLVAAVRLPDWTFRQTASTEVGADILILRKRCEGDMKPMKPRWVESGYKDDALLNAELAGRPEWFLGGPRLVRGKHGQRWAAGANRDDIHEHMQAWIDALPQDLCRLDVRDQAEDARVEQQIQLEHLRRLRCGSYALHEGRVVQVESSGDVRILDLPDSTADRVRAYIGVRDSVKRLLLLQLSSESDEPVAKERQEMNALYDAFVGAYKPISSRYNRSLLRRDPDYPLVAALEVFDPETQRADKSVIMTERTVRPRLEATSAGNPLEALFICLNQTGRVELPRMAALCSLSEAEVVQELSAQGRIMLDPASAQWVLAESYLCGNIVEKLEAARMAAAEDSRYQVNVEALEAAMPPRVPFKDISVQLGSTFVRSAHIAAFIDYLMENPPGTAQTAAEVHHTPALARWKVVPSRVPFGNDTTRWGTSRVTARKLVELALNQMTPTVRDPVGDKKYVVNEDATLAAREKLMLIQEEFKTWIGRDAERAQEIEDTYNRVFNCMRPMSVNGEHLTLPGLNVGLELRPHQKNAIWRNLLGGNTLVAHCVGAGKTLVGICTAMEFKRLGLRRCSVLTVPNHIVGQFASDFLNAYPTANLLVIDSEDSGKDGREYLLARMATGNYDAVIMSHDTFGTFGVSEEQLAAVTDPWYRALTAAQASASDRSVVKELERRKSALDTLVDKAQAASKKCFITFDQLGVDQVIVDESQAYKNLWYTTSMAPVAGLASSFSRRAFDMFIKVRGLSVRHHERGGAIFMSATPIANTVGEMYHLMRYMIMPVLMEKGIDQFDAWAANYGRTVVNVETTPEGGGFRLQTRFARFDNLPELMALFGQFADIQTKEDLNLPVPAIAGGKPAVVTVAPSAALKAFIQTLVERAEAIRSSDPEERPLPSEDNMLAVTSDGRMAALDMRLVGGADEPGSKINVAIDNIHRIWRETAERRLTQLVFSDLGTPGNSRCDLYQDIKDKLVARGVPAHEIAFVHDFGTPAKLLLLQARMNRGDVRILIASTEKAGTGFNVQRLLYALHELDCPWRPDQVEQRGGRIERQGNLNQEVLMFRYVTEGSFDAYSWNLVEQKMRFILQVMTSKCTVRSAEDIEVRALTVAEVKALATGNPRIVERALLQQQEAKLEALSRAFYSEQTYARQKVAYSRMNIESLMDMLELVREDVATAAAHSPDSPLVIGRRSFEADKREATGEALQAAFADVAAEAAYRRHSTSSVFEVGAFRGFKLGISVTPDLNGTHQFEWCIEGRLRWGTELGKDWGGNVTRIRNLVNRLPAELDKRQLQLEQAQAAADAIERNGEAIFPRAAELSEVREKLRAIEQELGIAEVDAQAANFSADADDELTA